MTRKTVKINRAPVLTLWAVVVSERMGYNRNAALTLGKAVAGLNAQSKGRRLGIFEEPTEKSEGEESKTQKPVQTTSITVLGRPVPTVQTDHGLRATVKGEPIDPESVTRYLEKKFGSNLPDIEAAMRELAAAYPPDQLAAEAYPLYEKFRPAIPEGQTGWGAAGELDPNFIRSLLPK
jgi:hypothetical protein